MGVNQPRAELDTLHVLLVGAALEELQRGVATHTLCLAQRAVLSAVDLGDVDTLGARVLLAQLVPSGRKALAVAAPRCCNKHFGGRSITKQTHNNYHHHHHHVVATKKSVRP